MVAIYQNDQRVVTGLPSGVLDKVRQATPNPRPAMLKRGSNVPRAYVFTGTGPGNGDSGCTRYDLLCNADGTLALNILGNPQIDTAVAGVAIGAPTPPSTRTLTVSLNTVTIGGWVGGARNGRWVGIPSGSVTGLAAGTYYAVNASGNSCNLAATRGGAVLTLPGGGASSSVTVRDGEPYSLDHIPEGDATYISDSSGQGRDIFVALPDDEWGLNPQRGVPLRKPAGVYVQKGYNVCYSGWIDHSIDYVAADGGVGFDVSAATPTVAHSGGGDHDQKQRAIRMADWAGVADIRGVRITGTQLYEGIDFSNSIAVGDATGVTGLTADPIYRRYWSVTGSPTGWVKNLLIRTASSQTAMLALTSTNVGDIINVTGQKSWKYLGGDRTLIASYQDLGTVNASGQFVNHSGGDDEQCWGIVSCEIDSRFNETHSSYQFRFYAWNDQLSQAQITAGATPKRVTIGGNRLFGYGSAQSGYVLYVTKAGTGLSGIINPPVIFDPPNSLSATFTIADPRALVRINGNSPAGGTATDDNGFYRFADFTAAERATMNVTKSAARPFRYLTSGLSGTPTPPADPSAPALPSGFSPVFTDMFLASTVDASKWGLNLEGASFGSPQRSGTWSNANAFPGYADPNATGGKALKLAAGGTPGAYTGAMLTTRSVGYYLPRYFYLRTRQRTPQAQGIWPCGAWFTAKNSGGSMIEFDGMEPFHTQTPGKFSITIFAATSSGSGAPKVYTNNGGTWRGQTAAGRAFYENPTDNTQYHEYAFEVVPVTDISGTTLGDLTQPSQFVRFRVWVDGVRVESWVHDQALYWSTNGGTEDSFWNMFIQGSQMEGPDVGDIAGPLGFSTYRHDHSPLSTTPGGTDYSSGCFFGGTEGSNPLGSSCTWAAGARLANLADLATKPDKYAVFVDYVQVGKATSVPTGGGGSTGGTVYAASAQSNSATAAVTVPAGTPAGSTAVLTLDTNSAATLGTLPTGLTQIDGTGISSGSFPTWTWKFTVGSGAGQVAAGSSLSIPLGATKAWNAAVVAMSGTTAVSVLAVTSAATAAPYSIPTSGTLAVPTQLAEVVHAKGNSAQVADWQEPAGWTAVVSSPTTSASNFAGSIVVATRDAGQASAGSTYGGESYNPVTAVGGSTVAATAAATRILLGWT